MTKNAFVGSRKGGIAGVSKGNKNQIDLIMCKLGLFFLFFRVMKFTSGNDYI